MWDVKACIVCFSTECILYKIDSGPLKKDYFLVSGLKASDTTGLPQYLCVECTAYVRRFQKFRDKCKRSNFAMKELMKSNKQITSVTLAEINREYLKIAPSRSYLNLDKVYYETTKFKWDKDQYNRGSIQTITNEDSIPVFYCSTVALEDEFEVPRKRNRYSDLIKKEVEETPLVYEVELVNHNQIPPKESTSATNNEDYFDNDNFDDDDVQETDSFMCKEETNSNIDADGSNLDEEYATMIPISMKEAKAVVEVYKLFRKGNLICYICKKSFNNKGLYEVHLRMHDQHISGNFQCVLCQLYYKTEFLLKTHMTDKHIYKYICKKCPEVSFDRISAKQHYIWTHLQKGTKKAANWYDCRPSWLRRVDAKRRRGVVKLRPVRKMTKLPDDFLVYTPVSQEEQYRLVEERKNTRNYIEATYKCEWCYKGFREAITYGKHMRKHDPAISGNLQCDMCKLYFKDARKVYKHMIITHLFKYSCQACNYICYNKGQAHMHYRWHKNVTYTCQYCNKEFKKASTRLTHIRIKHPSTIICDICGHSFVSENGLYCHKKLAHSKEEMEASEALVTDRTHAHYCPDCDIQFLSPTAYKTHLGSSNKHATTNLSIKPVRLSRPRAGAGAGGARRAGRPRNGSSEIVNTGVPTATTCEICNKLLSNDVQARKHYETEHPGAEFLKRYMCDVCGHTTRQYANLMVHMRTHTQEKPYGCPHCDRRFSMPSNRDRHLVVHTGEKKYQCQHCSRRFTQSSAVKLHIQTVHLKIPYAPWDKKNRKRRKEMESAAPVSAVPAAGGAGAGAGVGGLGAGGAGGQHKLVLDAHAHADYLNAYITYSDE